MLNRISELQTKEIVNVRNGCRLGLISDIEIDTQTGQISAIIIYGRGKMMGLLGRDNDIVIPWDSISMIGDDAILINVDPDSPRGRERNGTGKQR